MIMITAYVHGVLLVNYDKFATIKSINHILFELVPKSLYEQFRVLGAL